MKTCQLSFRFAFVGLALASSLLILAPAVQADGSRAGDVGRYRGQCKRLTNQINRYENQVLPMAIQRGNRAWEAATEEQILRLWNRRADLCPAYGKERTMIAKAKDDIRRFNKLMAAAGRAAATYFTGGIAGVAGP